MKCVVKKREYSRLGEGKTELVDSVNLEPVFKDGGTLTITKAGYQLATKAGEVLQRGVATDGIAFIKALRFDVAPLFVKDEVKGVSLPWKEYARKFSHGEIFRDKVRRFYVVAIKDEEQSATVFGITEKANGYTNAIHSVYVPESLNRYDRSQFVVDYVANLLFADEYAQVQGKGIDKPHVKDWLDKEHVRVHGGISSQVSKEECEKLALDAFERKETLTETFEQPIKYHKEDVICTLET